MSVSSTVHLQPSVTAPLPVRRLTNAHTLTQKCGLQWVLHHRSMFPSRDPKTPAGEGSQVVQAQWCKDTVSYHPPRQEVMKGTMWPFSSSDFSIIFSHRPRTCGRGFDVFDWLRCKSIFVRQLLSFVHYPVNSSRSHRVSSLCPTCGGLHASVLIVSLCLLSVECDLLSNVARGPKVSSCFPRQTLIDMRGCLVPYSSNPVITSIR